MDRKVYRCWHVWNFIHLGLPGLRDFPSTKELTKDQKPKKNPYFHFTETKGKQKCNKSRGTLSGNRSQIKLNKTRVLMNYLEDTLQCHRTETADIKKQQPNERISLKTCHKHCRQLKSFEATYNSSLNKKRQYNQCRWGWALDRNRGKEPSRS